MILGHFFKLFFALDRLGAPKKKKKKKIFKKVFFLPETGEKKFWPKNFFFIRGTPLKNGNFSKKIFLHLLILKIFTLSKCHSPMCWNGWDFREKKNTKKKTFCNIGPKCHETGTFDGFGKRAQSLSDIQWTIWGHPLKIKILKIGLRHVLNWPKLSLEPKFHESGTFFTFFTFYPKKWEFFKKKYFTFVDFKNIHFIEIS